MVLESRSQEPLAFLRFSRRCLSMKNYSERSKFEWKFFCLASNRRLPLIPECFCEMRRKYYFWSSSFSLNGASNVLYKEKVCQGFFCGWSHRISITSVPLSILQYDFCLKSYQVNRILQDPAGSRSGWSAPRTNKIKALHDNLHTFSPLSSIKINY